MKFVQTTPYGCGLYAIANTVNLPEFVTPQRLEASKTYGNTIGQLSKWLQEDGKPFYLDVLYYDHDEGKLPEKHFHYKPDVQDGSDTYLPVFINVKQTNESKRHLVGGLISKEGSLYLLDSVKGEGVLTSLSELNSMYDHVFGLFILLNVDTGDYVFFS